MILYPTKETAQRYGITMSNDLNNPELAAAARTLLERETGDRLMEWGVKLFYFERRKCLQVVNFASKLTFFMGEIKKAELENVGQYIAFFLQNLYEEDPEMKALVQLYLMDNPVYAYAKLTDRSMIATMNMTQRGYLSDGYRLYHYLRDGILHFQELNKDINREWLFTMKINGKMDYIRSGELFSKLLRERYGNSPRKQYS